MWNDATLIVGKEGRDIHSVRLSACLGLSVQELIAKPVRRVLTPGPSCPAPLGTVVGEKTVRWFVLLGQQRILERTDHYCADRLLMGGDEAMWRYLLRGLGYHQNTTSFWLLGVAVPWKVAAHFVAHKMALSSSKHFCLVQLDFWIVISLNALARGNCLHDGEGIGRNFHVGSVGHA